MEKILRIALSKLHKHSNGNLVLQYCTPAEFLKLWENFGLNGGFSASLSPIFRAGFLVANPADVTRDTDFLVETFRAHMKRGDSGGWCWIYVVPTVEIMAAMDEAYREAHTKGGRK